MLHALFYIYTLLYAAWLLAYKRGGHVLALRHVSACMLHFYFGIEAADASRHDKAEGPEPPRLNTHGHECLDGISTSCP